MWIVRVLLFCGEEQNPMTFKTSFLFSTLILLNALSMQADNTPAASGGLIVVAGCDDPEFIAHLGGDDRVVQALDTDPEKVRNVRAHLTSKKLYGPASARRFDGRHLPYVDNLVNLFIQRPPFELKEDEIRRVLVPGGEARDAEGRLILQKPWPDEIDQWTHFLHGPDNNAVAQDTRIDTPKHMQWSAGPRWSRHHDRMASLSAAVSAGGRLFDIMDHGPRMSPILPSRWVLTARDAFNGITLWRRPIPTWYPQLWPLKSGPAWLPRRIVATAGRVYVTLGLHAPVSQLDAATGQTIRTYADTINTSEMVFNAGILLVTVDTSPRKFAYTPEKAEPGMWTVSDERDLATRKSIWDWTPKHILAIHANSGEVLWRKESPIAPLSLAADNRHVVFHDGDAIVCLDHADGKELWKTAPASRLQGSPRNWYDKTIKTVGGKAGKSLPASSAPTLVLHSDVVLFTGGDGKLCGIDQKTGRPLWTGTCLPSGHYTPEDVFVAAGLVWTEDIAHGKGSGKAAGLDPRTGEVKRTIECERIPYHQRCYRSKATERFLLTSRRGIEFVDLTTGRYTPNYWLRGGCLYGILPCNGLIYTPPHNCACYIEAQLVCFNALAPQRKPVDYEPPPRLKKGPAFGRIRLPQSESLLPEEKLRTSTDWPAFRHDSERSGRTDARLPTSLTEAWRVQFNSRASQATAARGRVFAAIPDSHALVCLAAETGKKLWRFIADGRVDSPPAIAAGLCVFGSADGHVYCITADKGELAWRFRAAGDNRSMIFFGQPESVMPVSGSVLVRNGAVSFATGRSVFLDGGLRMITLDLSTGKRLAEKTLFREKAEPHGLNMSTGLPDILSCDGKRLYMRSGDFDLPDDDSNDKAKEQAHLFSPAGFLDDTWMHRTYWVYGTGFDGGAGGWQRAGKRAPSGRILCFDENTVFGYGRRRKYYAWGTPLEYHLFSTPKKPGSHNWSRSVNIHVRALLLSKDKFFIAGPPAFLDEKKAYLNPRIGDVQKQPARQEASWRGKLGATLQVVSTDDGETLAEFKLDYLPAFDGMSAAGGRLFIVSEDGKLVCYKR